MMSLGPSKTQSTLVKMSQSQSQSQVKGRSVVKWRSVLIAQHFSAQPCGLQ